MKREIWSPEHELFRAEFRRFATAEIEPRVAEWNARGISDRDAWRRMGSAGYLGPAMPEQYGGGGGDFGYAAIVIEELARLRAHALQSSLHSDICMPYLLHYGSEEQKQRFLVPAIRGECLLAIAMTEPSAGSDLAAIETRAVRDGGDYVINGAKTFISNGQNCDLVIVVAKTDPDATPPHRGISLILVETDRPGFERGRKLDKLGLKGQDTSELFFQDCRVPATNLLGARGKESGEGNGFKQLMSQLQQERLVIAVGSIASCRRSLDDTIEYVKQRRAFGQPIAAFQNTQFKLAELATQVEVGQSFVDRLIAAHVRGEELVSEVSMAKYWVTDLQKRLTSECLQLFGGYGFMSEYPISADYADAAVQTIYAGTNEIMKVIIARRLGLT
jgi:acyl-CoA dehydrogenase